MKSKVTRFAAPLLTAGAVFFWAYYVYQSIMENSILLKNGARYYWLDDDQMIAMRYARNFAEGNGLVFNVGERVEGYTCPLWVLVMAGIHKLGFGDAYSSLVMKGINIALLLAIVFVCDRTYLKLTTKPSLTSRLLTFLSILFCENIIYWCVHGFETTLLTLLFVIAFLRLLSDFDVSTLRWPTVGVLAVVPLVRSDYWPVWLPLAATCLFRMPQLRTAARLAISVIPAVVHVVWRRVYYGDWLPNTYYMKVQDIADRPTLGMSFLLRFLDDYGAITALTIFLLLTSSSVRLRPLKTLLWFSLLGSTVYIIYVGGDTFEFRPLSFLLPLAILFIYLGAQTGADDAAVGNMPRHAGVIAASFATIAVPVTHFVFRAPLDNGNGPPVPSAMAGIFLRAHAPPDIKIAVLAAGIAPYFSHLYTDDMLGKTDRHIAHLAPAEECDVVGHCKFDYDYSLSKKPDLLVGLRNCADRALSWPEGTAYPMLSRTAPGYLRAYFEAKDFRSFYFDNCFAPGEQPRPIWSVSVRSTSMHKVAFLKNESPF